MLFGKKKQRCNGCNSKISDEFSYCPYCGNNITDQETQEKLAKDYGLLGKTDDISLQPNPSNIASFNIGITDKLLGSLMNNLMKTLNKQFKHMDKEFEEAEIKSLPNGIKIRIGPPMPIAKNPTQRKNIFKKLPSEQQLEKMNVLPRTTAETKMKRLNDKIIYEINAPGIKSVDDIFVSKLESGYEIKAIAKNKIYVNSLPINLPIKSFTIIDNKLFVEFMSNSNYAPF